MSSDRDGRPVPDGTVLPFDDVYEWIAVDGDWQLRPTLAGIVGVLLFQEPGPDDDNPHQGADGKGS